MQVTCLSLVAESLTSKEIAVRLGLSRHTIDQHIRRAIHTLGVQNRRQAARMLRGSGINGTEETMLPMPTDRPIEVSSKHANRMSLIRRLIWIAVIGAAGSISTAAYLAGLGSLSRLFR